MMKWMIFIVILLTLFPLKSISQCNPTWTDETGHNPTKFRWGVNTYDMASDQNATVFDAAFQKWLSYINGVSRDDFYAYYNSFESIGSDIYSDVDIVCPVNSLACTYWDLRPRA